jgi:hypothetical protein
VDKGYEMVRRGLRSLDALEDAEREEAEVVVAVQSVGGFGVIDWSTILEDFTDLALPVSSEAPGGTVVEGAGPPLGA